jgi:kynurenine formamidase
MQGRGVLLDLVAHYGIERRAIGYEQLMHVIKEDGIEIESGDMLLLRTGYSELLLEMNGSPDMDVLNTHCCGIDGRDERLLQFITDSGISALAADNYAVELYPATPVDDVKHPLLPLHHHCLFKLGLPLGELWYLRDLAVWLRDHNRTRFMLTAPPLRLPGALGSPVTPIATV